jgi:hypothetical protein
MAYSCGYPDTINKKEPSPLKVRYASSGEAEGGDLQATTMETIEKDPAKVEARQAKRAGKKKTGGSASGTNKASIGAGIKKLFGG